MGYRGLARRYEVLCIAVDVMEEVLLKHGLHGHEINVLVDHLRYVTGKQTKRRFCRRESGPSCDQ